MLDFLEFDLTYLENSYSILDTFVLGFTYSFTMALPFSPIIFYGALYVRFFRI